MWESDLKNSINPINISTRLIITEYCKSMNQNTNGGIAISKKYQMKTIMSFPFIFVSTSIVPYRQ